MHVCTLVGMPSGAKAGHRNTRTGLSHHLHLPINSLSFPVFDCLNLFPLLFYLFWSSFTISLFTCNANASSQHQIAILIHTTHALNAPSWFTPQLDRAGEKWKRFYPFLCPLDKCTDQNTLTHSSRTVLKGLHSIDVVLTSDYQTFDSAISQPVTRVLPSHRPAPRTAAVHFLNFKLEPGQVS